MSRYRVYHIGICKHCGTIGKRHDNRRFVTPFFMPDYCEGCGKFMSGRDFDNPDWEFKQIKMRWEKKKFSFFRPSTWFGSWEIVQ